MRNPAIVRTNFRPLAALVCLGLCPSTVLAAAPAGPTVVRFGFSQSMFFDLNQNDARAAVKAYATLLAATHDLVVSNSPGIFADAAKMAEAFANGTADVISMPVQDFFAIPSSLVSSRLIAADGAGAYAEEYLLLVRNDSGLAKLSDLRGRRLIEYSSMRGCLAPLWLDVLLANADLGSAASFFSRVSSANKPIRTVLPVFFHQEDACIVTRRGFDIMGELNPQVMKQMRVLAQSPSYLPHVTTFRASLPPDILERIIQAALAAQETVTGQQMLTMFQSSRIAEIKVEKLNSVRELLADHARLFAKPKNAASRTTKPDTR